MKFKPFQLFSHPLSLVGVMAGMVLVLQMTTAKNYGIFRDEFYYLDCAKHLAWGYVDHPPFSIVVLALVRLFLGESVHALRLVPALANAALVLFTAFLAREMGGKKVAINLAALCTALAPEFLGISSFYSMNVFDFLFWAGMLFVILRLINTENPKWWLVFGILAGLGMLNKISVLFLGLGLVVGLLFTSHRKYLLDKYFWIGLSIASLLFLPHVLWQVATGWPTLEFISNAQRYKIAQITPVEFILDRLLSMNPASAVVWLAGLGMLLFSKSLKKYRLLGIAFLTILIFLILQQSKGYYLAAAFPILFAAGGLALEIGFRKKSLRWIHSVVIVIILFVGLGILPFAVPLLPVERFLAYQSAIGLKPPSMERNALGELPQHFADRFGWEDMARTVSQIYQNLPLEYQKNCVFVANNYGEASSLNYYRKKYSLPPVVCQHNNHYLWGYAQATEQSTLLLLGRNEMDLKREFEYVEQVGAIRLHYSMPYENNLAVHVCRGLRGTLEDAWKRGKHFI